MTKPLSKGAASLELVLAGKAGLHRGRIAHDLTARILALAPSTPTGDRAAVLKECSGDRVLAELCFSLSTICRDWLAGRPGSGDDAMRDALVHAWEPLHRTEAQWRDAGAWADPGINPMARATLHDAVAFYLHMLGRPDATVSLVETIWAHVRAGSEHSDALIKRAAGLTLMHEPGEEPAPVVYVTETDPLACAEIHALAFMRPTTPSKAVAPARPAADAGDDVEPVNGDLSPVEIAARRQFRRTLDAAPGLREALAEGAVVLLDVPERLAQIALSEMPAAGLGLPAGTQKDTASEPPKGSDRDRRGREFLAMLQRPGGILLLSPDADSCLPAEALRLADHRLTLAPIDASDVTAAVRATTGRTCSPADTAGLDGLRISAETLTASVRPGRTPAQCVAHLFKLATPPVATGRGRDLTLDELHGARDAVAWCRQVTHDLQGWREGAHWSTVSNGGVFHGPPGTGKTLTAQAFAASAGVPLVTGSLPGWQSVGQAHLGTTLQAMRKAFADAKAMAAGRRGCILLIEEIDTFVDRRTVRHDHADYTLQIGNGLLECLDGVGGREGVVVIGTTNDIGRVDPAILRPGRLGKHIEIGFPDAGERVAMLRVRLGDDLVGADLMPVSHRTEGHTGAMIEALVEDARRRARHAGRPLVVGDLLAVASAGDEGTPAAILDRIAVHEAGHAVLAHLEQPGREMVLALQTRGDHRGWMATKDAHQGVWTLAAAEENIRIMLGGRAAEEALLDSASSGARQDLMTATSVAVSLVAEWGMGGRGLVSVEQSASVALATDVGLRRDVSALLDRLYGETLSTVRRHADAVRRIADALVERRRLDGDEVARLVAGPLMFPNC